MQNKKSKNTEPYKKLKKKSRKIILKIILIILKIILNNNPIESKNAQKILTFRIGRIIF